MPAVPDYATKPSSDDSGPNQQAEVEKTETKTKNGTKVEIYDGEGTRVRVSIGGKSVVVIVDKNGKMTVSNP